MGSAVPLHFDVNTDLMHLLIAVALGGAIGMEREFSNKSAGLRTNILICMGACLFMIVSRAFQGLPGADATRIAAQVVSGIGFLGAGAILRDGEHVVGLTTAATIWTVAAIGMAVGGGSVFLAGAATAIVLFVQLAFTPIDTLIDQWQERHTFRIVSKLDDESVKAIDAIFREAQVSILRRKLMKRSSVYYSEWLTSGGRKNQEVVMKKLMESPDVMEVTY